ncbi:MAG: SIS domain-containing protein, partial [Rickettsiales bacterium]|nr:SIS domain-containing protein [Rickettsiales bacterium]
MLSRLNKSKILSLGKKSVETEMEGLKTIVDQSIDDRFVSLVNVILNTKGRIFLSAIGKPSYIARKAAASLASTGTPSFFIHPAEASHGDLGMITKKDVVILLSNSGGSTELNDIVAYCKSFGIELICITRRQDSFLAKSADIAIILQNMPQTNAINS